VREDIPAKLIKKEQSYEGMFIELNLKKQIWLISCSYNPNVQNINLHLQKLQNSIDCLTNKYERILLLGDFNCEMHKFNMPDFCASYNLKNLISSPTCYKNLEHPTCIDHMLTNFPKSFQSSITIETGLSDFHKMTIAVLKTSYRKLPHKQIKYRCFKKFNQHNFRTTLQNIISNIESDFSLVYTKIIEALNKLAPIKTKTVRGNNAPFMTKTLRKAIMLRSKLRNLYLQNRSKEREESFKRQRNHCVTLLRQAKKDYFEKINENNITDNKKFWKLSNHFSQTKLTSMKELL